MLLPILVCRCRTFISECVRYLAEEMVKPWLGNLCSKVVCSGSHYDGTGLPGKDDFDVQICINLPGKVSSKDLDISAYAGVVGGPSHLCDGLSNGLSIDVLCNLIIFTICLQLNWFAYFNSYEYYMLPTLKKFIPIASGGGFIGSGRAWP